MDGKIFANNPDLWLKYFPSPSAEDNKYDRGHVLCLSGGMSSTGAARLAARGALHTGAGLVTLASPKEALLINAISSLSIMVRGFADIADFSASLYERHVNTVVLGPGGGVGEHMRQLVLTTLASPVAAILDADALTSFADDLASLKGAIISRKNAPTILTPHEGEFARLFQGKAFSECRSKNERAAAAAEDTGAIMVLKGANTVVASPEGEISVAENAPPWLATAGSGDVLAGIIAGLLAQKMPGFMAAAAGVWLHGEAANLFGRGLIAEDLPDMLPKIYQRLFAKN